MNAQPLAGDFARSIDDCLKGLPCGPVSQIGLAVSGGSDSTALLLLADEWAKTSGVGVKVATVDHRLRPESAAEAQSVADLCRTLGLPHATLEWSGWDGVGNLQDAARTARRQLIACWARAEGIPTVALGHTQDDQAETVLMRLARGSGVDGLSGMARAVEAGGILWLRPLLDMARADLRGWLSDRGQAWIDDPGNQDPRFDRVRARKVLQGLGDLGIDTAGLSRTADAMSRARKALETDTIRLLHDMTDPDDIGTVRIDIRSLLAEPEELVLRVLSHALNWVSGAIYRPRLDNLVALHTALHDAEWRAQTLHGCLLRRDGGLVRVMREPGRTGPAVPAGSVWDNRWETRCDLPGVEVGELGLTGLALCADWRAAGWPREAVIASPAFRQGGALIAAPFALPQKGCHVALIGGRPGYFRMPYRC